MSFQSNLGNVIISIIILAALICSLRRKLWNCYQKSNEALKRQYLIECISKDTEESDGKIYSTIYALIISSSVSAGLALLNDILAYFYNAINGPCNDFFRWILMVSGALTGLMATGLATMPEDNHGSLLVMAASIIFLTQTAQRLFNICDCLFDSYRTKSRTSTETPQPEQMPPNLPRQN